MSNVNIETKGSKTAQLLLRAVRAKWFGASARVSHWQETLGYAYQAVIDGDDNRLINLPKDATTSSGDSKDKAIDILNAFNHWLGRDIVWRCLEEDDQLNIL
jgi:hypothetical protein